MKSMVNRFKKWCKTNLGCAVILWAVILALVMWVCTTIHTHETIQAELTQKIEEMEKTLKETKKDLSEKTQENVILKENVTVYEQLIKDYAKELEELNEYKKEKEQEERQKKLKEMKNNPKTPTLDFLPYLQGDFEENLRLMSIVIYHEAENSSDEEQQLQGLVLLNRCFHPYSFSDGNGNIESAIFKDDRQYPWSTRGIENDQPNERNIANARAVLTGQVLDTPNIKGMTRDVEYANTTKQGTGVYCQIWNPGAAKGGKWVYFCYGP